MTMTYDPIQMLDLEVLRYVCGLWSPLRFLLSSSVGDELAALLNSESLQVVT